MNSAREAVEIEWGYGRGPGRVWPEVNVFSQLLLAAAVSSVTGRRGDSDRKGAPPHQKETKVSTNDLF